MAHPVHEYRQQQAELQAQIAELQARLDAIAPAPTPAKLAVDHRGKPLPHGTFEDDCGVIRWRDGREWAEPQSIEQINAKIAQERRARDEAQAAEWAKMTEGCPAGYYRGPCGKNDLRSIATGEAYGGAEYRAEQLERVERIRGQQHRQWLREGGVPVRPRADDEDDL